MTNYLIEKQTNFTCEQRFFTELPKNSQSIVETWFDFSLLKIKIFQPTGFVFLVQKF